MNYGKRLIFDKVTGKVLNGTFDEMSGDLQEGLRPMEIDYIDLPYGYNENNFKEAIEYYIDVTKPTSSPLSERIVITKHVEHVPTYEELQQQLLIAQGVI